MSLLSSIILPMLEKQLAAMEPQAAQLIINEFESIGGIVAGWLEEKAKPAAAAQPAQADVPQ